MKPQIKRILSMPYARILIPDDDGTYTAEILEFPGCFGEGDTAGDAINDLEQAAASWIEAAIEQGQEIPPPMDSCEYSGKINLRLPKSIHKQAARFAERDDISLNQLFLSAIAARIGAEEFCEHLLEKLKSPSTINMIVQSSSNAVIMYQPGFLQALPESTQTDRTLLEWPKAPEPEKVLPNA
ncbi:hypothetical protein LCGC14_1465730 [marine sediment metagenome]|uniref:HicB-like antitoxin of toxin-antitoxin system domain-containing protein n=1 Tax=marine sediment metagenome TaxID=412755 RepID=A0A0F9JEE8_9ZZZZ